MARIKWRRCLCFDKVTSSHHSWHRHFIYFINVILHLCFLTCFFFFSFFVFTNTAAFYSSVFTLYSSTECICTSFTLHFVSLVCQKIKRKGKKNSESIMEPHNPCFVTLSLSLLPILALIHPFNFFLLFCHSYKVPRH